MTIHIHAGVSTSHSLIPHDPTQCHIWTEVPQTEKASVRVKQDEAILSTAELERASRFYFEADYLAYVAAHALVRRCLSRFVDIPARKWRFDTGPHGRPFIAPKMNPTDIHFNLSHTRTLVACAITLGAPCGIDVETIGRSKDPLGLARANFSENEIRDLEACEGIRRDTHFTALWCLKEAYLKAEGVGLTVPLNRISFELDDPPYRQIQYRLSNGSRHPHWKFELFTPSATHFGALAYRV